MKTLAERLDDANEVLASLESELTKAKPLPQKVDEAVRKVLEYKSDIPHWKERIEARSAALDVLKDLDKQIDKDGRVFLPGTKISFAACRTIFVQAYLATSWSLADSVTGMVGRVLCTTEKGMNPKNPVELITHFVNKRIDANASSAAVVCTSIRETFGWPIGLAYAIRNDFIHNGGQSDGDNFFAGPSFAVSQAGWDRIVSKCSSYGLNSTMHRRSAGWPADPLTDFRAFLQECQEEVDDALGILIGSAYHALKGHVAFMLGED